MYHRVLPREQCVGYPLQALVMPVDAFDEQMAWLASRFVVLPVRDAIERLKSERIDARPMVSVTFDDGYLDNYQYAAPIMEAQGLRGTFFVTSGFIDTGEPLWFDRAATIWGCLDVLGRARLYARLQGGSQNSGHRALGLNAHVKLEDWMAALKRVTPCEREDVLQDAMQNVNSVPDCSLAAAMNPGQLAALHRAGHEVASHSLTHPILTTLEDEDLRRELTVSRTQVAGWIDDEVAGFCYPNGDLDDRVAAAVSAAGYRYACATTAGLNFGTEKLLSLHRRSVTMQRALDATGCPDHLGFRGEVCGFRELWR